MALKKFTKHVAGKVVERVVVARDEDTQSVDIQFKDRTGFHIEFTVRAEVELDSVELINWKTGNKRLVKKYV